ncbi:MAG: hypothetical protein EPO39_07285 [Candidatus Manganitrophaceae bacterium]|nr:MAG: hypothetical protein EPO39_07285 [Candidatus Manganitrophaceae bacterium]
MKYLGLRLYLIVILLCMWSFIAYSESPKPTPEELKTAITLEIVPTKERFLTKDRLFHIKVLFKNRSPHVLWVNRAYDYSPSLSELTFDTVSPSGKRMPQAFHFEPRRPDLNKGDFIKIRSGQTYEALEDIKWVYLSAKETGTYKITATYKNNHTGKEFGVDAWVGEIKSNTVTFEVVSDQ